MYNVWIILDYNMDLTYVAIAVFAAFIAYFVATSALAGGKTPAKPAEKKKPPRKEAARRDDDALRKRIMRRFKDD